MDLPGPLTAADGQTASIPVRVFDETHKAMLGARSPAILARAEDLEEHGLSVNLIDIVAHGLFVNQRDAGGLRTLADFRGLAASQLELFSRYWVNSNGQLEARYARDVPADVTERLGVGVGLLAANEVLGISECDWERIPKPRGGRGKKTTALDFLTAATQTETVELECKGAVVKDSDLDAVAVAGAKVRAIADQKAHAEPNSALRLGVVTTIPVVGGGGARCWIADPTGRDHELEPGFRRTMSRLVFYHRVLGLLSTTDIVVSLADRIRVLVELGPSHILSGVPLTSRRGQTARPPTSRALDLRGYASRAVGLPGVGLAWIHGLSDGVGRLLAKQDLGELSTYVNSDTRDSFAWSGQVRLGKQDAKHLGLAVEGRIAHVPMEGILRISAAGVLRGLLAPVGRESPVVRRMNLVNRRGQAVQSNIPPDALRPKAEARLPVNEADTCRKYVVPKLQSSGWENDPHSITEQKSFTDGRIIIVGSKARRQAQKRADYLLRYTRDFLIAVVEAKASYKSPAEGLQQAKDYATILGLKFAYATNGHGIVEFDFLTGIERELLEFPTPAHLWIRLRGGANLSDEQADRLLTPAYGVIGKTPRYYQETAINRAMQAIVQGQRRVLLTMATGTGKTFVAFQICWKLWSARWNRTGDHRKPRILFLADRNILVDDPYAKMFAPFGDARAKIEGGNAVKSREMYFSIYQALAADERRPGLYKDYAKDFFDLIIVDECHRGSARDESSWREILEYFEPAYQLGMTATPLREDNRDTYLYFGNPIIQYSLKQGIEDGFLAPYRVHRVITTYDAAGWRPSAGDTDRLGREIPDREYTTKDFERVVALRARTEAIASHLTDFLKNTDRFGKTIVFCVDQEHASEMRRQLSNLNADVVQQHADYVCRVTADEGDIGRGHLSRFQELETDTPTILTTSQLLTTGVDAPTVKNVVLARVVGSMSEFKQIIGRGTRVRDDYGKLFFNILDYTGSATTLFADPDFDGDPARVTEEEIDEKGKRKPETYKVNEPDLLCVSEPPSQSCGTSNGLSDDDDDLGPRKYYFDGGQVQVAAHLVYELDPEGRQLRVVKFTDYTAERVRTLFPTAAELRDAWADPEKRADIIEQLAERGIDFDELTTVTSQPDADPFDLLCHVAYSAPLRTRRERADRVRKERREFLEKHSGLARQILEELLEKYAEHGTAQFVLPDVLQVPPISDHGNVIEIAKHFGGAEKLREAIHELQTILYAA